MALPDWTVPFGEAFGDWKDLPLAYPGWRVAIPLRPGHLRAAYGGANFALVRSGGPGREQLLA